MPSFIISKITNIVEIQKLLFFGNLKEVRYLHSSNISFISHSSTTGLTRRIQSDRSPNPQHPKCIRTLQTKPTTPSPLFDAADEPRGMKIHFVFQPHRPYLNPFTQLFCHALNCICSSFSYCQCFIRFKPLNQHVLAGVDD